MDEFDPYACAVAELRARFDDLVGPTMVTRVCLRTWVELVVDGRRPSVEQVVDLAARRLGASASASAGADAAGGHVLPMRPTPVRPRRRSTPHRHLSIVTGSGSIATAPRPGGRIAQNG